MANFFEKLKEDTKDFFESAKDSFEDEAAAQDKELSGYHDLFAWADGTLLAKPYLDENASDKDKQMKTLLVLKMRSDRLLAPCDGTVVKVEPDQNTIVIRTDGGTDLGLKVCVGSVSFEKDAEIAAEAGQKVRKGDVLVTFTKPVEAKSKLFTLTPEDYVLYQEGYLPVPSADTVRSGDPLLTKSGQ